MFKNHNLENKVLNIDDKVGKYYCWLYGQLCIVSSQMAMMRHFGYYLLRFQSRNAVVTCQLLFFKTFINHYRQHFSEIKQTKRFYKCMCILQTLEQQIHTLKIILEKIVVYKQLHSNCVTS